MKADDSHQEMLPDDADRLFLYKLMKSQTYRCPVSDVWNLSNLYFDLQNHQKGITFNRIR